jgi:hypothetical protein
VQVIEDDLTYKTTKILTFLIQIFKIVKLNFYLLINGSGQESSINWIYSQCICYTLVYSSLNDS